jgi:2-polyprenyl-3-methyl-5-hydroxy-6-metoxy-1,4-benzoquinol methylase
VVDDDAPADGVSRRELLGLGFSRLARELDAQRALDRLASADPEGPGDSLRDAWGRPDSAGLARRLEPVAERLVEASGVRAGERVLDSACGDGNVALAAARRGAEVTAVDFAPAALERARARAASEGLQVEWLEGDVHDLPAGDGWFDHSLSAFGVTWAEDARAAIDELFRVTRPEGKVALATWSRLGFYAELLRLVFDHGLLRAADPAYWGREAVLREELEPLCEEVSVSTHRVPLGIESPEAAWRLATGSPGPIAAGIDVLPDSRRESLRADVQALAARHALEKDGVEAHWLEVVARLPEGEPP